MGFSSLPTFSETSQIQVQEALQRGDGANNTNTRILYNLRCNDVEGGLLGRSLLSLVNNKVLILIDFNEDKFVKVNQVPTYLNKY